MAPRHTLCLDGTKTSVRLSMCLYLCPSVGLSVYLYVCLSICMFVCMSVCVFVCVSIHLFVCVSIHVSFSVSSYPCVSIHPCLSVLIRVNVCVCVFLDVFRTPAPGKYSPEKSHPPNEKHAPAYSMGSRTRYRKRK